MEFGDVDRMFDEAHHVSELATSSSRQMHGSLEAHVSIAEWSQKGDVTVYNSPRNARVFRASISPNS